MPPTPVTDTAGHHSAHAQRSGVPAPRSLPLDDIAARFRRNDLVVSVADVREYAEVEALSRAADPHEMFLPVTADVLAWFADQNPHGPGFVVIARPPGGGAVVGYFLFYATTLVQTVAGVDRTVPAYLYVNLYVSPEYRRKGVFATMFAFGLEVLNRMGIRFAYTVPNPRSSPGFVKFGVPWLGTLPCWVAPALAAWRSLAALTSSGNAGVTAARVSAFDESMILTRNRSGVVRGLRTPEALNWRFARRPGIEYGIWRIERRGSAAGCVVTRVMTIQRRRVLAICDLDLDRFDAAAIRGALGAICRQTADRRYALVMVQGGPPDPASRRALWRAGLIHVPDRLLPQPVAVLGGDPQQRGSTGGFPPLNQWALTPCDWDVF